MLHALLSKWITERKVAAQAHLTQDEVNLVRTYLNAPLKPLTFTFAPGDRIKCYPTQVHAAKRQEVVCTVLEVERERGWFVGCTVEILGSQIPTRIPGGSVDWILRKI